MEVEVQKDTSIKVEEISEMLGLGKQEIVNRALTLYIDTISKYLHLKKEMNEWDTLSDEALLNFEKSL